MQRPLSAGAVFKIAHVARGPQPAQAAQTLAGRHVSAFAHVPQGPPDKIFGLVEKFKSDENPSKVNLVVGAYRDNDGKPVVLPSVRAAEKKIFEGHMDNEYASISGIASFIKNGLSLQFGENSPPIEEGRVAAVQALSGTGSLRLVAELIARQWDSSSEKPTVHFSDPTWGNHHNIFQQAGLKTATHRYLDYTTNLVDIDGMVADMKKMAPKDVIVLHAVAHNPTGADPTEDGWRRIMEAVQERELFPIFDNAYQGYASGDCTKDAYSVQTFALAGIPFALTQSFAKNFGLYGQRTGIASVICDTPKEAKAVESQLKILTRALYSNPPVHGARIVDTVLSDQELRAQWLQDVKGMATRIESMRTLLKEKLAEAGSKHEWDHITSQIGMFAFTGLSPEEVTEGMTGKHAIYMTPDGRISVAGLNTNNVDYVAQAIHESTASR